MRVRMSWQAFNSRVAKSNELNEKLKSVTSPFELLTLAREEGFELTNEDLQAIAENAFDQWISQLDGKVRLFFEKADSTTEINEQLRQCQTSEDVIALAKSCEIEVTQADLKQASDIAQTVEGFSWEKLFFKQLGLIR